MTHFPRLKSHTRAVCTVAMAMTVAMDTPSSPSGGGNQFPDSSDDDHDDGDADDSKKNYSSRGLDVTANPLLL